MQDNSICLTCNESKSRTEFVTGRNKCKDCNNKARRLKYRTDNEHRQKVIQRAIDYKCKRRLEEKVEEVQRIGIGNKECRYCNAIKCASRFRHNRRKCKDCERDDPYNKFTRTVRTRIWSVLKSSLVGKDAHTDSYIGCSNQEYQSYILNYDKRYTHENYGTVWHVDHVIPISKFDLSLDTEKRLALNWRNTMPLSRQENLQKNNRIDKNQILHHFEYLKRYHSNLCIELPDEFVDLFATHLDAGNPLELTATTSN